jgi:hypothetical protein
MALKQETLPPGLREMLERYLANPLKAAAEDAQPLLDHWILSRQGRPESAAKAHIRALTAAHPKAKPAMLYELRDQSIIKSMSKEAFRNTVAAIRRETISHR